MEQVGTEVKTEDQKNTNILINTEEEKRKLQRELLLQASYRTRLFLLSVLGRSDYIKLEKDIFHPG